MDVVLVSAPQDASVSLPIAWVFWGFVWAYVVHIIDESMLGENFVEMVRRNFWPEYEWKHFFGFNTLLMSLIVLSVVLFELFGGAWIVLPLTFVFQMFTNGLWHLGQTVITRRYSPGLLTSVLYWLLFYFVVRYSFLQGQIRGLWIALAGVLGTLITVLMIGSFFLIKRRLTALEARA